VQRDVLYIILGSALKLVGLVYCPEEEIIDHIRHEWHNGVPHHFGWRRKLKQFFTRQVHFLAFLFAWVGLWNVFDLYVYNCGYCWQREIFYIFVPLVLLFISQEVLTEDTMYWFLAKSERVENEELLPGHKRGYSTH